MRRRRCLKCSEIGRGFIASEPACDDDRVTTTRRPCNAPDEETTSSARPELGAQLAGQCHIHAFTGFDLAAGKLPQATLMQMIRTLGQQDAAILAADHRGRYMHSFHA